MIYYSYGLDMKTLMRAIALILFSLSAIAPTAFAQSTRPVSGIIAVTTAPVTVTYAEPGQDSIGRQATTGDPIYLNDEIATDANTNLQILLKDQTVFSIGPDSSIIFDEFVYDPASDVEPTLSATVTKGAFKFISGKVSKANPQGMKLNLPNATASIRGTSVAGRVREDGSSDVVLLSGAIAVNTPDTDVAVDIFTSGWGMNISPTGFASDPVQFSTDQINDIVAAVEFEAPEAALESFVEAAANVAEGNARTEPLTPEEIQATIEEASTLSEVAEVIALVLIDEEGDINAGDLSALLLSNANLLAASNIDPDLLDPENNVGVNVDAVLVQYALAGGEPVWMKVLEDSGSNKFFGNTGVPAQYAGLISSSYSGSASFSKTGLELGPDGNNGSGSALADYSMVVDYDDMTINGSMSVYDIVLGGRSYNDLLNNSFASNIANDMSANNLNKLAQFDLGTNNLTSGAQHEDENGNGILETGETFEAVQLVGEMLTDSNAGHNAFLRMNVSLGSISDGNNAVDGRLGGVEFAIEEIDTGTNSPTGNFINGVHYSAGTLSE